jgi:hypothetical protein
MEPFQVKRASGLPLGALDYGGAGAGVLTTPFIPFGTTVLM